MWGGSWEGRKRGWCQHTPAYLLWLQWCHTAHLSKDLRNPTSISSPMTVSRQILFLIKTSITFCAKSCTVYEELH